MIACYCRISTHEQKVDSQKAAIKKWLQGNGIPAGDVQWYEDTETGATTERPAFTAMQKVIFNGELKTVVIWSWIASHGVKRTALPCSPTGASGAYGSCRSRSRST